MTTKKKNDLEQNFAQLEKLTEELQSDDLDLEAALTKFEAGLLLAEKLKKRLNEIENKMETIKVKFKDQTKEVNSE
jgi:exodeoxyribonuclease VII small subunit